MAITLTNEKRFIVLLSIFELGGVGTKREVLDNIQNQGYFHFSEEDLAMKTNRHEIHWRNDLAFVRKYLVDNKFINGEIDDQWKITTNGESYLIELSSIIINSNQTEFHKLTSHALQKAQELIQLDITERTKLNNDLEEDQMTQPNESYEVTIQKIKRYKKIVDDLKKKYGSKCQIEGCGITFTQNNGNYYAEGHHLIPLSSGGSQEEGNVVILCANHHRMFHYANVHIEQNQSGLKRPIKINDEATNIVYL